MWGETRTNNPLARFFAGLMAFAAALVLGVGTAAPGDAGQCPQTKASAATGAKAPAGQKGAATTAQPSSPEAAGAAGMRAFIDPATGQLREPTPEEAAALNRFVVRALALPTASQVVQHPNGMLSVALGDEYMNDVIVRKNPDGTLSWVCAPHPLNESVLTTPAPPKSPDLEKE